MLRRGEDKRWKEKKWRSKARCRTARLRREMAKQGKATYRTEPERYCSAQAALN